MGKYQNMSDEDLIAAYQAGNDDIMDYICVKYKPLVLKKAKTMYLVGGETDDLIQEGMLGLFKAIRDYKHEHGVTFYHFAELCIDRQIKKAIEASNRKKNQPLNTYVSIYNENGDRECIEDMLQTEETDDPEKLMIASESVRNMKEQVMGGLSKMEQQVLELYLQGYDYHSIAQKMNRTDKVIDNALQRIRQKVRKIL